MEHSGEQNSVEWGEQQEVWRFELKERVGGVGAVRTEVGHNRVDLKQSSFIYLPFISKAAAADRR